MRLMEDMGWRERLADAVARSGRSERDISLEIGRAGNYLNGVLKLGKEPSLSNMVALAAVLEVSLVWLVFGREETVETEELLKLYASLDPSQRKAFLALAKSIATPAA